MEAALEVFFFLLHSPSQSKPKTTFRIAKNLEAAAHALCQEPHTHSAEPHISSDPALLKTPLVH